MPRHLSILLALSAIPLIATAQHLRRDTARSRNVHLSEVVVSNRSLKQFSYKARAGIRTHWVFTPGKERVYELMDSTFLLVPIPPLSAAPVRLQRVELHLSSWDTTKMRLNLIVIQVAGGDTSYRIHSLPMQVRRNWLSVKLAAEDIILRPGTVLIGYSFAPIRVPEEFHYRLFMRHRTGMPSATISSGRLRFDTPEGLQADFPLRLFYEEL